MCKMLGVWSLAYIAIFALTVVNCDSSESERGMLDFFNKDVSISRTFGRNALKRLSFIFLPVMFTLGVISTLLMALAVISVKNLAIGVILLIVGISQEARAYRADGMNIKSLTAFLPVTAVSRLFAAPVAPAPLVFHPRAEILPAPAIPAAWPPTGPALSPWGRSDNEATITD